MTFPPTQFDHEPTPAVARPANPAERIVAIDALRGIAILGILVMNIQSFAMPVSAYSYPWSWGDMSGLNGIVYYASHVLASGKFISIFAMLFGAGITLRSGRSGSDQDKANVHVRRMLGLIAFGIGHAYLFWYGDILFTYGLLGMLAYVFRKCSIKHLIWIAVTFFAAGLLLNLAQGAAIYLFGSDDGNGIVEQLNPPDDQQMREVHAYQGSLTAQLAERIPIALISQTYVLLSFCLPFVTALMLCGMALMKSGFFHGEWSRRTMINTAIAGITLGWTLTGTGVLIDTATGRQPIVSVQLLSLFNTVAMVPTAIGYSSAILLLASSSHAHFMTPFVAVGKTALSCYLLETVLCTTVFYGHGLGWFGTVNRVGQVGITVCVWLAVIALANSWTCFFRFGPAEWIWRGMTYGFSRL